MQVMKHDALPITLHWASPPPAIPSRPGSENLLLDEQGVLKISDFGLSNLQPNLGASQCTAGGASWSSRVRGGLVGGGPSHLPILVPAGSQGPQQLHTMCGTPEYVAPEVLRDQGYNGYVLGSSMTFVWALGCVCCVCV